jgi:hypothetical protein
MLNTEPKNLPTTTRELSVEETEAVAGGSIHVELEPPPIPGVPPPPPKVIIT